MAKEKSADNVEKKRKRPKGPQEYKGAGNHEWEIVQGSSTHSSSNVTQRLRVPGGWLYRYGISRLMTFVPVPPVVGYVI